MPSASRRAARWAVSLAVPLALLTGAVPAVGTPAGGDGEAKTRVIVELAAAPSLSKATGSARALRT